MSTRSWKTALAISALIAASGYTFAQMSSGGPDSGPMSGPMSEPMRGPMSVHGQMPFEAPMEQMHQGMPMEQMHHMKIQSLDGSHGGMSQGQQSGAATTPTMPGQDAFGTIQEIVQILQSDPQTDWAKVDIEALRQHLVDMNEVTLHAVASQREVDDGIEITVTGEGRTLEAIKRMLPAHVRELKEIGWDANADELPDGVKLTFRASAAYPLIKLKALGFMGILVQGSHHQQHHLMMARGQLSH